VSGTTNTFKTEAEAKHALSSHDLDQNSKTPVNYWKRREAVSMLRRGLELMQAVN
jgi:hypothetical protein